MNGDAWKCAENIVPQNYVRIAKNACGEREKKIRILLEQGKMPIVGWDNVTIELLLSDLSLMDSNNFPKNCGAGEREARIASDLVAKRHYNFGHGIGRSGDLKEVQPKAVGSSLMSRLTNNLLVDLFKALGLENVSCLAVPMATGMSILLCLLCLKQRRPNAKYVIWSRIDQKSCFKSIVSSGLTPIIIDMVLEGEQLVTNITLINDKILELGTNNIVCVITTTSCFAPRACDEVESIASLCQQLEVPHLINNAYGLQDGLCMKRIRRANLKGRVDVFVQSTDKNLMVPVGGAIIAGFDAGLIDEISKSYPGRASSSPIMDVFITLLHFGVSGYKDLLKTRNEVFLYLQNQLKMIAEKYEETVLHTPGNCISIAMTLKNFDEKFVTQLGAMLFHRNVSGARVVPLNQSKEVVGYEFLGWNSHCANFITPYLTAAAAVGMTSNDADVFIKRLDKALFDLRQQCLRNKIDAE